MICLWYLNLSAWYSQKQSREQKLVTTCDVTHLFSTHVQKVTPGTRHCIVEHPIEFPAHICRECSPKPLHQSEALCTTIHMKMSSFASEWNLVFIWKDENQDSLWGRGLKKFGNGLLTLNYPGWSWWNSKQASQHFVFHFSVMDWLLSFFRKAVQTLSSCITYSVSKACFSNKNWSCN